jgi:hypothetical protein
MRWSKNVTSYPTVQLKDLCRRLNVRDRDARYVLERGFVPDGVDKAPDRGNHRQFDSRQAFWLAMVLKLKQVGLKTPTAAAVANYAEQAVRTVTQNLNWDFSFLPSVGKFDTDHRYFVEVGDGTYIRFVTDANPSVDGLDFFDWHPVMGARRPVKNVDPCVILRLDLSRIAAMLQDPAAG